MESLSEIDSTVSQAENWHDAAAAIRSTTDELTEQLASIVAGLEYTFPTDDGQDTPFGPMWVIDGKRYPLPLAQIPEDAVDTWVASLEVITNSLVRSRLADLLWVRKVQQAYKYAQIAYDAYNNLAATAGNSLTIAHATCRSLEIAVQINDQTRLGNGIQFAVSRAHSLLDEDAASPTSILQITKALISLSRRFDIRGDISELLTKSATKYSDTIHILSSIREFQIALHGDNAEQAKELARTQVAEWLAQANTADGLIRMANLERAREIALANGLADELTEVRSLIGKSSRDELGLTEFASTFNISQDQLNEFENAFFSEASGHSFLGTFGSYCPLPQEHSQTEDAVRSLMREHPFQFLITRVILNEEGLPIKYLRNEDDHFDNAVMRQQVVDIQIWTLFAARLLDRALSTPEEEAYSYVEHFRTNFIKKEIGAIFVRGFELFKAKSFDECVCTVAPRLEAVIREMARQVGVNTYADPQGDAPGGHKTLGALLASLEGRMPEVLRRYLIATIGDPMGVNLRNRLCHGLLVQPTREEAALTLHLASMLATLRSTSTSGGETP